MCDFTMITLENEPLVGLTLEESGNQVFAAYDGTTFDVMQIIITDPNVQAIDFTADQLSPPVTAEARRWCRDDGAQWANWTVAGSKLVYKCGVPPNAGDSFGYEFKFGPTDPKIIISRKGQNCLK